MKYQLPEVASYLYTWIKCAFQYWLPQTVHSNAWDYISQERELLTILFLGMKTILKSNEISFHFYP